MSEPNPTLEEMIGELGAGIFTKKFTEAIKLAAIGTIQNHRKGSVVVTLEFNQIGESDSVTVKHTLKYCRPTKNGDQVERDITSTPMYVNREGYLTISPQLQEDLFKNDPSNSTVVTFKGK